MNGCYIIPGQSVPGDFYLMVGILLGKDIRQEEPITANLCQLNNTPSCLVILVTSGSGNRGVSLRAILLEEEMSDQDNYLKTQD